MGTPDFAVPAFNALTGAGYSVPLVVTQPDRPKGRGRKLTPPPVKLAAQAAGCEVIQPEKMTAPEVVSKIRLCQPDVFVVVAFGHILKQAMLDIPSWGCINIHASLLPKYRGPAPIHRAIAAGERETGVTIMRMDPGLDTGDILMMGRTPIGPEDTTADLHDRLADMGADLLLKTLAGIGDGTVIPNVQDHASATYAPLLTKADGRIDWTQPTTAIDCQVRGMTPWPGAFTVYDNKRLKIFRLRPAPGPETPVTPGTVLDGFENELRVATGDGAVSILELQGASGKRMDIQAFLRGTTLPPGTVFSLV